MHSLRHPSRSPYQRLFKISYFVAVAGVLVFSGWYAWFSWHRYEKDSQDRLAILTHVVAVATQNALDGHALSLWLLGKQLQRVDAQHHPRLARAILSNYQVASPDIASANLIAPDGQVIASTASPAGKPLPNLRHQSALWPTLQTALQRHSMQVYRPVLGPLVGHWVIRLTYTVFAPSGKPAFLLTTPIRVRDGESFLRLLPLSTGMAVGLLGSDFYIMGRQPVPTGGLGNLLDKPQTGILAQTIQQHPALRQGFYEGLVTTDRQYRYGAFAQVQGYPLYAFVDIPRDQWLAAWWRRHIEFPLIFLVLTLGYSGIAYRRIRALDRRWENQQQDFARTLTRQATHDVLTDLPNREGLRLVFNQALARADRQERLLAVGFLDLDAFKPVNDAYGHAVGDILLKELAVRLQGALRRTDTVARLGGDEFVLLLEGLRNMEELDQVLARLQEGIEKPFLINGETQTIQASLGLTVYPFDEVDTDLLLRHADQAMYAAKARAGRA
ncbi:diguanylate cyclase, partial [Acidithiobacillus sp. MC6.1]|nr:diguanylate cyclase [Acidithiobacillus sp. MC6.1]